MSKKPNHRLMLKFFIEHHNIRKKSHMDLDPRDEQLIQKVALSYKKQERLSVKDLMGMNELGSPATIHARIKKLTENDTIEYELTEDARRYQVVPTQKLLKYFDLLGLEIDKII